MDKMFSRFEGIKSLKKSDKVIHNVVNSEVVDVSGSGSCLRNDNVDYVNLVDDCDEDVFVSEHRFENEDFHENSEFMHDSSETRDKSVFGEEDIVIPFLSQNFPNLVATGNVIRAYSLKNGFAIKIQNTQRRVDKIIYTRTYVCNLAGENRDKEPVENEEVLIGSIGSAKKKRGRDKLPRSGCKFRIHVINRERDVVVAQKNLIKSFHVYGIAPRQQMNKRKGRNFFIRTLIDEEGRLKCLLWVDPRSLLAYKNFGDVVAFDTTYRTIRYAMPFVPFTGVNHHYQLVLFGFALMRDELKTTFEWVLGTWLEVVEGKVHLAIITDQDQAMAGAIQSQLPNTTHLLCSWHISNKFLEKLSTYYVKEEFKGDFNNCIYHSLTEEIF
ncbi:protein FAR1-RELATED SEQUENCE 2-like [Apium graveolens]|uniref:protein FAR1-RELATED SEQUENCE 2-like n=1 Tax=Apium graveolens TaxID=4045 RepID=UPI003D78B951